MTDKLTHPDLNSAYALDVSLDTLEGYDRLQIMLAETAAAYPGDEYHTTLQHVAEQTLQTATRTEITQAQALEREARSIVTAHKLAVLSGEADTQERIDTKEREIDRLKGVVTKAFEDVLSEATTSEREMVQAIAQRKIGRVEVTRDIDISELASKQLATEAIKEIMHRPVPRLSSLARRNREREALPNPDIALSELQGLNRILLMTASGIMTEHQMIAILFPEHYATNRPEAFKLFDEMYGRLGKLAAGQLGSGDRFIQKGRLHQTGPKARVMGKFVSIVYRGLLSGDKQLKSKGTVEQRLEIDSAPHLVLWEEVTPNGN